MFDIDRWQEIWSSVSNNKLRTFFAAFTIALALFIFIVLSGLGKGLHNGFQKNFFGANSLNISLREGRTQLSYDGFKAGRKIHFKNDDYNYISEAFSGFIKYAKSVNRKTAMVRQGNQSGKYDIVGTQAVYSKMTDDKLLYGRNLIDQDSEQRSKVVVIGKLVVSDLFKGENPVGKNLNIDGIIYQIVGVYNSEDGDNANRILYLPITTMQLIYSIDGIDEIELTPKEGMSINQIAALANTLSDAMKTRHHVAPEDPRGIRMRNGAEAMTKTNAFLFVISGIVFFIGFGSLIAGIVSIANIMVFTVKERTKEIGIRKALGARPASITGLILQEAISITLISGCIGIVSAVFLTDQIKDRLKEYFIYHPSVDTPIIIIAGIILFVSGLLAGWVPAKKASQIKPIVALKDE